MRTNEKKGISLIVLVLTIIVMIILASAIILSVSNSGIIGKARKAVFISDMKAIEEEVSTYIANSYIENLGSKKILNVSGEDMVSLFPSTKNYKEKIMILNGKIVLKESATTEEKEWASEANISTNAVVAWDGSIDTSWYNKNDTEFKIYTAAELAGISQIASQGEDFTGKTIKLMNDIDLDNEVFTPIATFAGTFDGNNHTINLLHLVEEFTTSSDNNLGLFVKNLGDIQNLTISDYYIDVTHSVDQSGFNIGILVGANSGRVANCLVTSTGKLFDVDVSVDGDIDLGADIGAIAGTSSGTISKCALSNPFICYFVGSFSDSYNPVVTVELGGIVGDLSGGSAIVEKCKVFNPPTCGFSNYSSGYGVYAGGICGYLGSGSITQCYATVWLEPYINASSLVLGGIVGGSFSTGNITNCLVESEAYGEKLDSFQAGGIAGEMSHRSAISNCVVCPAQVDDLIYSGIGAFSGIGLSPSASNCYAIGGYEYFGEYNKDNTTSGYTILPIDANAKKKATYSDELWDSGLWDIDEGETYPYLKCFEDVKLK